MLVPSSALQAKEEVKEIIGQYQAGQLEAQPGRSMAEVFEGQVRGTCGLGRKVARVTG